MYHIPYFKEKDPGKVIAFMRQHPFAMLIGCSNNLPVVTQIPVLTEEREGTLFLYGHIMKNTDHHRALQANPHALCVFTGPHAYVSARWYTNPQVASTWNYLSVHARGTLRFLDDTALRDILHKTTALFENDHLSPASFHHLPHNYVTELMNAIVAFELHVQELDHVFKLSQNRDEESYRNIMAQLEQTDAGGKAVAAEMRKRLNDT